MIMQVETPNANSIMKYLLSKLVMFPFSCSPAWKNCQNMAEDSCCSTQHQTGLVVNFMVTPCINNAEPFLLPTDAHNVKKRRVIKTF